MISSLVAHRVKTMGAEKFWRVYGVEIMIEVHRAIENDPREEPTGNGRELMEYHRNLTQKMPGGA